MASKLSSKFFLALFSLFMIASSSIVNAQTSNLRVEPPSWWAGMNNPNLQLLVYGKDIANTQVEINYPGVMVKDIQKVENPNYLFINLELQKDVKAGNFDITFRGGKKNKVLHKYNYQLAQKDNEGKAGFSTKDVIYLLMPDRFSNGDPSNDSHPETIELADRTNPNGRHGGDIKGIQNHLDYIKDLGMTAIWINPLLENNNKAFTYHGYAITDFYKIDPRYGSNNDYAALVKEAHSKGLKVVMDMIFNHSGINHWFIKDLPMKGWIHEFPEYTSSNFRAETVTDPHASEYDKNKMLQGWFDTNMPDLDQRNPLVSNYLIQNSIWWIEFAKLDGIRMDTQPYPYKQVMTDWAKRVFEEYPTFNIVGEAWLQKESMTAYYQKDNNLGDGYNSHIPSITDFPLYGAMNRAFTEQEGWSEGMARLYHVLAQDFLYANPYNNLIFPDNHDLNRFFTSINKDIDAYKLAMAFVLTTRGIPQIYYGTEILMEGDAGQGHGQIRKDFPGGWAGDTQNMFTAEGRSADQNDAFNYLKNLLNWRQDNKAIHEGTLKHYLPQDGVYVYFREKDDNRVMVVLNNSKDKRTIDLSRFNENLKGSTGGKEIISNMNITFTSTLDVNARQALIIELSK